MYTTEGIVLKKYPAGEADAVFSIYTKDYGKIRALAQGIKKEDAKLKGHLEPLSLSEISFVLGKSGERLINALLIDFWDDIRSDFKKLTAAYYIVELVDKHCFPGQRDEPLWDMLVGSLREVTKLRFESKDSFRIFAQAFEEKLLNVLGYAGEKDIRVLTQ